MAMTSFIVCVITQIPAARETFSFASLSGDENEKSFNENSIMLNRIFNSWKKAKRFEVVEVF